MQLPDEVFKGKVVIAGVGNVLRSDDGFGPVLVNKLQRKINADCLDAGSAPENFTGDIIKKKPDTILIVDALYLGASPGQYKILTKDEIAKIGFSTHDISLPMLIDYLEERTGAGIYVLGVQPETLSFGEGLSDSLKKSLDEITEIFLSKLGTSNN